ETAAELGCTKIAFGHHKDDIAQTILMNMLFEGQISGMCPKQEMFGGKVFLIRPLAYIEEKEISLFAKTNKYPVSKCNCSFGETSKRAYVKKFLNELEKVCPPVKSNVFKSLSRIKKDYLF
ncbi:MAG TPA: ATP-binding protein, partial [Candidatus Omnitrophota bacterium]|nr:ATP-binding protein [Candidatus Omnitrophota bacterium]